MPEYVEDAGIEVSFLRQHGVAVRGSDGPVDIDFMWNRIDVRRPELEHRRRVDRMCRYRALEVNGLEIEEDAEALVNRSMLGKAIASPVGALLQQGIESRRILKNVAGGGRFVH